MHYRISAAAALAALLLAAPVLHAEAEKPAPVPAKDIEDIPKSPAEEKAREGLETWAWSSDGPGQAVLVSTVKPKEQAENRVLKIDYLGTRGDKVSAKCPTDLFLAEKGMLSCQIYSAEKSPPKVAFSVCTSDKYVWQECEPIELKEGWNEVKVDLGGKKWKSAASGWKHEVELQGLNDVRALHLLVYNGRSAGLLYVDGLQADRDEKFSAKCKELVKKLGEEKFEDRENAEKELAAAGRPALEYLREAAENAEPEVAQRAKRVMDKIEHPKPADNVPTADAGAKPKMENPKPAENADPNAKPKEDTEAKAKDEAPKAAPVAPDTKAMKRKAKKEQEKEKAMEAEKTKELEKSQETEKTKDPTKEQE